MIAFLHGYLLEGSGSNLWTRSILTSLCKQGHTLHLICQEPEPQIYEFIAEAYEIHGKESRKLFERTVPFPGKVIFHRPKLDVLPVYVWDEYKGYSKVAPMVDMPHDEIAHYLDLNTEAVQSVVDAYGISALHVNHAVLMSVVAERVKQKRGIPYAIMPHGSAIEYAVKKDARFYTLAVDAFRNASRVFLVGGELRQRLIKVFPDQKGLPQKMVDIPLSVDTSLFEPEEPRGAVARIERLCERLEPQVRGGRSRVHTERIASHIEKQAQPDQAAFESLLAEFDYDPKKPDEDLLVRLNEVDWSELQLVLFVGRLIANKGIAEIFAALPDILAAHSNVRLLVAGHGPLRDPLEAILQAVRLRRQDWVENLAQWYDLPLRNLAQNAELIAERVFFTGYLDHTRLKHLYACSKVAVFPSMLREAGPLVFFEALASGCIPLGTNHGGMEQNLKTLSKELPEFDLEYLRLRLDSEGTIADIAAGVPKALRDFENVSPRLVEVARAKFDWAEASRKLVTQLESMRDG